MADSTIPLIIKWGKETLEINCVPAAGVKHLKQELQDKTNVPVDRMKLMAKSKGLWKGILKDDFDLTSIDWNAIKPLPITCLLMGSAAKLSGPKVKTVFLEDLPPEEIAKVKEPSGLVNLGNTCYLNSVTQCLRSVDGLRKGLMQYTPNGSSSTIGSTVVAGGGNTAANALLLASLRDTFQRLDAQHTPLQPATLVQATQVVFPQFAQRGPQGQPMQQDAEEFYSGILTAASTELSSRAAIQAALGEAVTDNELAGADNLIDALFGMKMKETLTCDELTTTTTTTTTSTDDACKDDVAMKDDTTTDKVASTTTALVEPPVISYDLHRKLVCNIQGGSEAAAQANVSHIAEGIQLALSGKIEKHSEVLGRNAIWTRTQRIARLPPFLTVQFGRFYWKATPDSHDHAGVKCKIMKPVAFSATLDVFDFCTEEIQKILKVSRDKALAAEEDRINKKLKGTLGGANDNADAMDTTEDSKQEEKEEGPGRNATEGNVDEEMDEDLKAALAMSMEETQPPVGPGLPENFQGIYELFAVVTHKGRDADGGHYMAWVKANNNNSSSGKVEKIADTDVDNEDWFVFDDDEVSPCKTEDVLKLKGGGDWHMSYLNFYRAKK